MVLKSLDKVLLNDIPYDNTYVELFIFWTPNFAFPKIHRKIILEYWLLEYMWVSKVYKYAKFQTDTFIRSKEIRLWQMNGRTDGTEGSPRGT